MIGASSSAWKLIAEPTFKRMIHNRTSHPLTPAIRRLPRPVVRGAEHVFRRLLRRWRFGALELRFADGRVISAGDPDAEERGVVLIHDRTFLARVILRGEMGAGESFVAGEWSSPNLVQTLSLFLRNLDELDIENVVTKLARIPSRIRHRLRANNRLGSESNIHAHYDLGNDFYRLFLGESWAYSCGYWRAGATTLEEAQEAKVDRLIHDLLKLDSGDHLLEIGCGWGSLALRAAQTTGCRVTAITVSREQFDLAQSRVRAAGLEDLIDLRFCDYRDVDGQFTKVVSVEMIEAVGYEFLGEFFQVCADRLVPGGLLALQSITMPEYKFDEYRRSIDWTQLYIFPGSLIPSVGALSAAWSDARLNLEVLDDIGTDYAQTLAEWNRRFHLSLSEVRELGFDDQFIRLWNLYLSFSEAAFAERSLSDAHLLLRKREH